MRDGFLGLDDAFLDAFELGFELGHLLAQRLDRGRGRVFGAKLRDLAADFGFLCGEPACARIVLRDLAFELPPLGAQFRRLGGERGKGRVGLVQRLQRRLGAGGGLGAGLRSHRPAP